MFQRKQNILFCNITHKGIEMKQEENLKRVGFTVTECRIYDNEFKKAMSKEALSKVMTVFKSKNKF